MDNITLNKNQLQAILELVNQIGSNRSQNGSLTSLTPTWERKPIDTSNGNDFYINQICDGDTREKNENLVTTFDDNGNIINLSSSFGDNQIVPKTMETTQSNNDNLFWKIGNNNRSIKQQNEPISPSPLEYSYPYFSHSISTRPLIKSQSLGAIDCSSLLTPSAKDSTIEQLGQQLVTASSISSLVPPRTAPSPSQSLVSFDSAHEVRPVNFRRYARSVTSSLGGVMYVGNDWEEKRRKMLKYRAELAAQKEEKDRREREEREKARAEEEAAERRMIAVQRRLKEEYELERRLIEEKRDTVEKRRLAVVAAMEQSKVRGRLRKDEQSMDYTNQVETRLTRNSVSTQTESNVSRHSTDITNDFTSNESNLDRHLCSTSAQTDISLLFDLIRSLGFSTMTLKDSSDDSDQKDTNRLGFTNGLNSKIKRLNRTARARLGRNGLKFDLSDNLNENIASGSNEIKRSLSKSASHTNLTRIGKSRIESNPDKSSNRLKTMSSSSTNLFINEVKPVRLKGIINQKKKLTSNLPLINSNQQESLATSIRKKITQSTLEGIL